ncbi:MAG: hypothetical protein WBE20_04000 [Candidatus Acidiferrales bacterium]
METKKTAGAIVAAFILRAGVLYVIYSMLLRSEYVATSALWRTQEAITHRMWIMLLAQFIFTVGAVLIYQRGIERKSWIGQGFRFGILLSLVSCIPGTMSQYVAVPMPHRIALHDIIVETGLAIVMGLLIAAICQPKTSAA